MASRQCEKRLWLEVYLSYLIAHGSDVEQRYPVGEDVNDAVRAQYPDGVLVYYGHGAEGAVEETQRLHVRTALHSDLRGHLQSA